MNLKREENVAKNQEWKKIDCNVEREKIAAQKSIAQTKLRYS